MVISNTQHFRVFDFDIEYEYSPDDSLYEEIAPTEFEITVIIPHNFDQLSLDEQTALLKDAVMLGLEDRVTFDTPDDPEFGISDVSFCFEKVDIIRG